MRSTARDQTACLLLGAGATGLLVSLFLAWSSTGFDPKRFLVLFGAVHRLQDELGDRTAWEAYPVAAGLLAVLAALLGSMVLVKDLRVRACVALLALGGVAFAAIAIASPPRVIQDAHANGSFVLAFGASAGAGEIVAIGSVAVALIGMAALSTGTRHQRAGASSATG